MNQIFNFLFLSIIFTLSYSFDFKNYDYNNILVNPYRVFGLPPWSSMKDIKKKISSFN